MCGHERQVYFEQTLPCARPMCVGHHRNASVSYWRDAFEWNTVRQAAVRVVFRTNGREWTPERCLIRGTDSRMDDAMDAAGLSGAFV